MTANIDYSRQYSHWHIDTIDHARQQAAGYRAYLDLLGLPKSSSVLDVGCGRGYFLLAAKDYGFEHVRGVDSSPEQVQAATAYGLPAELIDPSSDWFDRHRSAFDAIFLFDVLEHIPVAEQIAAVRNFHAALKPGGVLLLRVPNAASTFAAQYRWIDWTHHASFTEYSLDFVLYNGGFRKIEIRDDHFGRLPLWLPRLNLQGFLRGLHYGVRRLQAIAEFGKREGIRMPLTLNIVAIARK